ncbi:FAD-dependent oxidoreductase [Clostridium sediminicola]|uniref:FAD-dependent oxidoreductase n=1 Tax=Clostridium sediminicola TaxID=3114879 RepID=UPI0031F27DC3
MDMVPDKTLEGLNESFWIKSTNNTNYPSLEEDISIDVAIIGGGIAGLTSAFELSKSGVDIALFEANKIAKGTSAHTTAKITPQHNIIYSKIQDNINLAMAKQYAIANQNGLDFIIDTIKKNNIQCDLKKLPSYIYTQDESYIEKIEKESKIASTLGFESDFLTTTPLPFAVKCALCCKNAAEFHPRKYLLTLGDLIINNKGRIYEDTTIINILKDNDKCILISRNGAKVRASKVIIASHFPCYDGFGLYFSRLKPERSYIVASSIKPPITSGMFINAEEPRRSVRFYESKNENLVLVGGENHKTAHGNDFISHYQNLIEFTKYNFDIDKIKFRWSTQDYITPDGIPYIGHLTNKSKDIYVATGFGKWGMTNGTAAGILLKDLIINGKSPWQDVFNPSRFTPRASTVSFFVENFDSALQFFSGKLQKTENKDKIKANQAKVVKIEGKKYGAYRDNNNKLHLVDITCTHLGCELKWNEAEKTWDCPCHGSRFSFDGTVIEGPAMYPLNKFKEPLNKIHPNLF